MSENNKTDELLKKLKETTENSGKEARLEREQKFRNKVLEEEQSLKEKAKQLFNELMTEEKLVDVAKKCFNYYPILLIVKAEHGEGKPVKNKKTGYRYNIGKLGEFLFDELFSNGYEPVMLRVDDCLLENCKPHNPHWIRPFDKEVVSEAGWYLGIEW